MPTIIEIDEFLALGAQFPTVDVRSPGEFEQGHIPGAVNIPVFSNEERAKVGTLYNQEGHDKAYSEGLQIVGLKLAKFIEIAQKTAVNGQMLVHCWRGGMRSSSMAELFESAGLKTFLLKGGYKSYRNHVLTSFDLPLDIRIVGGETGSGKTEILHALRDMGEQIVDLEQLASHRGSSFGALGMKSQPSFEHFENTLLAELKKLDPTKRVWIEDESRSIGRVYIPAPFWARMEAAPIYRVHIPFEVRVQRLIIDYGNFPKDILKDGLDRIKKRLGGLDYKNALEALENGDLATATELALRYYDKAYNYPHEQKNYKGIKMIECESGDPRANAKKILESTTA